MVLRSFYNSLSWTNKRRVDAMLETYNKLREWVKPKTEEVVSKIEMTKVSKPKKVETVTELFPENHKYIGYRIEKHSSRDRIFMIEEPPHDKKCACDDCIQELANEILNRREAKQNETK